MGDTILKISENQEENKNLGDIISKLNLFLDKNGLDKDGVDFIKGSNSVEEKEIEDKLEKLKTTQEQIECLGDFLNNLQKREKNKINSELNKEKLDYNSILSQYGIENKNGKIDLGKKFKIEDIDQKTANLFDYYKKYNEYIDKFKTNNNINNDLIKEINKINEKNNKELLFQSAIYDSYKSKDIKIGIQIQKKFGDIKSNIFGKTKDIEEVKMNFGKTQKENHEKLSRIIFNENEIKSNIVNLNIQKSNFEKQKNSLEDNKKSIKTNILEINNLLNNKNISKEDLEKLKKQKEKLKKDLEKINKDIKDINIFIKAYNDDISYLEGDKEDLIKDFKKLLEKQKKRE